MSAVFQDRFSKYIPFYVSFPALLDGKTSKAYIFLRYLLVLAVRREVGTKKMGAKNNFAAAAIAS